MVFDLFWLAARCTGVFAEPGWAQRHEQGFDPSLQEEQGICLVVLEMHIE